MKKDSEKEQIAQWMFDETKRFYQKNYVFPNDEMLPEVAWQIYDRIEKAGIRISYSEIEEKYRSEQSNIMLLIS